MYVNIKTQKKKTQNSKNCSRFESLLRAWHPDPAFFILPWVIYIYTKIKGPSGHFFRKKNIKNSNFRQGLRLPNFRCLSFFDKGLRHTQIHIHHQIWKPLCLRHVDLILSTAANAMDRFKVWRIYRLWFLNSIIGNLRVTYKSTVEYLRFLIEVKSVFSCFLKFLIPTDAHNDMAS